MKLNEKTVTVLLTLLKNKQALNPKCGDQALLVLAVIITSMIVDTKVTAQLVGFSPRVSAITLYFSGDFEERHHLLEKFGKHTTGKGCIYVKKLNDINIEILEKMIAMQIKHINKLYPTK